MPVDQIKLQITADDKASPVLEKLGGKLSGVGEFAGKMAKVVGTAALAAGGALAGFGVSSIKAFIDAEAEMAVATRALQNTFDNLTKKEVSGLKKELGSTTVSFEQITAAMNKAGDAAVKLAFDDEEASQAFAKLFSVTKSTKQAQEELQLAMDLAAYSGRSLGDATQALMMVHAGGTRVLKEFGIDVKEGTTAMQAMDLVQQKVTGSAQTMADTTAGKLRVMAISWQNLKEEVGATLAEAVNPFITKLAEFVQSDETKAYIMEVAQSLKTMAAQLAPVVSQALPAFIQVMKIAASATAFLVKLLFQDIPNAVGTAVAWFVSVEGAINRFIMRIDHAIQKVREFIREMTSFSPSNGLGFTNKIGDWISNKLGFASGGIVPGPLGAPQLALVHGGEQITPAPGMRAPGGTGGVYINITGNSFRGEEDMRRMAEMVGDEVMRALRQNIKF